MSKQERNEDEEKEEEWEVLVPDISFSVEGNRVPVCIRASADLSQVKAPETFVYVQTLVEENRVDRRIGRQDGFLYCLCAAPAADRSSTPLSREVDEQEEEEEEEEEGEKKDEEQEEDDKEDGEEKEVDEKDEEGEKKKKQQQEEGKIQTRCCVDDSCPWYVTLRR
eukprot:GHVU01169400.1.p1 GENE.GHVU01169400.1~~GHVU01169400.1.p1  ORF type:complete len:166 (+),score=67.53 GHVU01169400.1:11-508(+)